MTQTIASIPLDHIDPHPGHPRRTFDQAALEELGASIREHGVMQPITVEANGSDRYIIQLGERSWRGGPTPRLAEIPPIAIAARLILLELDPEIQQFLASGQLHKDPRVARALLDIPDREVRVRYATEAARRRFSIQGILIGSRRIAALVEAQELERGKTPSLAFAVHRRAAEWNRIRQVELDLGSRMPSWETVKLAADAA